MKSQHVIVRARQAAVDCRSQMLSAPLPQPWRNPRSKSFYRGQTVKIVVASGPSGGFDTFARLLARHLGRFVPGNPTFVVQNMPGAGGLRAAGFSPRSRPATV